MSTTDQKEPVKCESCKQLRDALKPFAELRALPAHELATFLREHCANAKRVLEQTAMELDHVKRAGELALRLIRDGHVHDSHFAQVFHAILDAMEG